MFKSEDFPEPDVPKIAVNEAEGSVPNVSLRIVRLIDLSFASAWKERLFHWEGVERGGDPEVGLSHALSSV